MLRAKHKEKEDNIYREYIARRQTYIEIFGEMLSGVSLHLMCHFNFISYSNTFWHTKFEPGSSGYRYKSAMKCKYRCIESQKISVSYSSKFAFAILCAMFCDSKSKCFTQCGFNDLQWFYQIIYLLQEMMIFLLIPKCSGVCLCCLVVYSRYILILSNDNYFCHEFIILSWIQNNIELIVVSQ